MTIPRALVFAMICSVAVSGCGEEMNATASKTIPVSFEQVTPEQWARLGNQRIFFGHQSVGGNLLDGIQDVLKENPGIPLRIVEAQSADEMRGPGLYHARIGKNGEPSTKLNAFSDIVETAVGDSGTALLKYCYVDVTKDTDPKALFAEYQQTVGALRARHPDLKIVHVTLPLRTDIGTLRYVYARARKLQTGRDVNLIRHQYNELLRNAYSGKEPVFDLAALQSTEPNGGTAAVRYNGASVPVLANAWTYDGGHLNEAGRKKMAKDFLATLANLY